MKFNFTIEEIDRMNCSLMGITYERLLTFDVQQKFLFGNEVYKINRLQNKALAMFANSPAQLDVLKKIEKIKKQWHKKNNQ
jgi:hypothetical protein